MPATGYYPLNPIFIELLIKQKQNDLPVTIKQLNLLNRASKMTGQSASSLTNSMNKMGYYIQKDGQILDVATGQIKNQGKAINDATKSLTRFKMYYLSMMFTGMLVSRMTDKFMRDSIGTMMKMTEGQSQSAQAILSLTASWEYLKFSIGDAIGTALEPVLPYIIDIVDGFADFVQQNPEATFAAIFGLFAAGTTLMAIGQVGMFMQSLAMWKASPELKNFTAAGGGMDKILGWTTTGVGLSLIFKGFSETNEEIGTRVQNTLTGAGLLLLQAGKGKEAAILMGAGFSFKLADEILSGKMSADDVANAFTKLVGGVLMFSPDPTTKSLGLVLMLMPKLPFNITQGQSYFGYTTTIGAGGIKIKSNEPKRGGDFIITKSGQFIQTSPQDTIFASKTGTGGLSIGNVNVTINTNNISNENKDQLAREIGDKIVDEIKRYHR